MCGPLLERLVDACDRSFLPLTGWQPIVKRSVHACERLETYIRTHEVSALATAIAMAKIEFGMLIIKTAMAANYESYKDTACLLGVLSGIGSGIVHIYMRKSGYSNLSIISCASRCVLYVLTGAKCYNSYKYVRNEPIIFDVAANALMFQTIRYYSAGYACVLLIDALPNITIHERLYRATKSFVHELLGK